MVYLTGLRVDKYEVLNLIGEGAFATVYQARNTENGSLHAIKAASESGETGGGRTGIYQSCALEHISNGFSAVKPDPIQLLDLQYEALCAAATTGAFVSAEKYIKSAGGCYLVMPFLTGPTLRELLTERKATMAMVREVVRLFERNQSTKPGKPLLHGDLKPENIMFVDGMPILIDPGFHGYLMSEDGRRVVCSVTTPVYYPFLDGDDLLAAGLILWETITGDVLLDKSTDQLQRAISSDLEERILFTERTGNQFYSSMRAVQDPRTMAAGKQPISESFASLAAKAVRLRFDSQHVADVDSGFASFSELGCAIDQFF